MTLSLSLREYLSLLKVIYYRVSKSEENLKNFAQGSRESAPTQKEKYFKVFRIRLV